MAQLEKVGARTKEKGHVGIKHKFYYLLKLDQNTGQQVKAKGSAFYNALSPPPAPGETVPQLGLAEARPYNLPCFG